MKLATLFAGALAALAFAAPVAGADPSFACKGRMTAVEHTICDTPVLGELDRAMSGLYFARRDHAPTYDRHALQRDQVLWLRWRDTCGAQVSCLRRRYEQRIIDLAPRGTLPPGFGCAEQPYGSVPIGAELLAPARG